MAWLWWIAIVGGPVLLAALLIWGTMRTRSSPEGAARADRGARELRDELAREDETRA